MTAILTRLNWLMCIVLCTALSSPLAVSAVKVHTTNFASNSRPFYGKILVTQIKDAAASFEMDVFPNPPAQEIHVKFGQTESGFRLRLIRMENGEEMYNESIEGFRKKTIDIAKLESGKYHLHLLDAGSRSLKIYEIQLK